MLKRLLANARSMIRKHEEDDKEDEEGDNHENGAISAGVPPYDSSLTVPLPKQPAS